MPRQDFKKIEAEILSLWTNQRTKIINQKMSGFVSQRQIEELTQEDWGVVEDVIEVLAEVGNHPLTRSILMHAVGEALRSSNQLEEIERA